MDILLIFKGKICGRIVYVEMVVGRNKRRALCGRWEHIKRRFGAAKAAISVRRRQNDAPCAAAAGDGTRLRADEL